MLVGWQTRAFFKLEPYEGHRLIVTFAPVVELCQQILQTAVRLIAKGLYPLLCPLQRLVALARLSINLRDLEKIIAC